MATHTLHPGRLFRFQCDAVYAANGTVSSVQAAAFFKRRLVNDSDATDVIEHPQITEISYNLIETPATGITAAGITVTRAQLAALIKKDAETRAGL